MVLMMIVVGVCCGMSWWGCVLCGISFGVLVETLMFIQFSSERSGGGLGNAMVYFLEFISEIGLLDIPLSEGIFTWSNNRTSKSWSRIDHFLFSPNWDSLFPEAS